MPNSSHNPPSDSSVRLDRQDPYLRLQSVTIFVSDLDRSLDFYVHQLGFRLDFDARLHLPPTAQAPARRWVVVSPPDGTANLVLVAPSPDSDQFKLIGRSNLVTFITEDLLAKFRDWNSRGVRFHQTPRLRRISGHAPQLSHSSDVSAHSDSAPIWGGMFARFRDPDGNSFSLAAFDEVTHSIESQRRALAEKLEAERRAAQELEIAKQVQARLFPQNLPSLKSLEFAGVCLPARHVGGDYYDFLPLGPARVGLVIGDISGKGIAAALLMANLQANVRSQCAITLDEPHRLLSAVNQLLCANTADAAFATLFFAEYDDCSRRIRYVNCGHLPPLVLREDHSLARLSPTATILGVFKDWDCELAESQLCPGDTLILYTDGITESFNPAGDEFGEPRLLEALQRHRHLACQELCSAIVDELRRFSPHEQHDDITLIVAKCLA
jgi:serine phosphatase RsbU (regulator of sigma subunit)/catechol 2,3-dioxygenase-like lactoylglutathione lyase family enzyme